MALTLEQKKAVVAEVSGVAAAAHAAVAAEYRGLSVEQMTQLRTKAREAGVYVRVVKNRLARRAVAGSAFECMQDSFTGPLVLAFSQDEPASAARVFNDFARDHGALVPKVAAVGGKLLGAAEIPSLAKMPSYKEAISLLMAVMKAPLDKLARTLAEPHAKLVRTMAAVRDSKQTG